MKIFKFTVGGSGELPTTYYLNEIIGFNDTFSFKQTYYSEFIESIGFSDQLVMGTVFYNISFSDTIGFGENLTLVLPETLEENIGFNDNMYQPFYVANLESIGFNDEVSPRMIYSITLEENIGFVEVGNAYKTVGYKITWRTRTRNPSFGYGGAEYGANVSYGDGNASDLYSFRVKVYRTSDSQLLRNLDIVITDTDNPDDDAEYIYTSAYNISDNGYFEPNLTFEVYQIDTDSNVSPVNNIIIEPYSMEK